MLTANLENVFHYILKDVKLTFNNIIFYTVCQK